jgi:hypothetical protein
VAKKSKRQSSQTNTAPANPTGSSAASPQAESASRSAVFSSSARSADKDFNPDYSYVVKDLRRIGTLAGFFFAVLIVLSFFLN